MKIIFDNEWERDRTFNTSCPSNICLDANDFDYRDCECSDDWEEQLKACAKCWKNSGIELEVKEVEPSDYNYNDAIDYIHAHTNLDKNVIDIILNVELDYMKSIGIAYELDKENDDACSNI